MERLLSVKILLEEYYPFLAEVHKWLVLRGDLGMNGMRLTITLVSVLGSKERKPQNQDGILNLIPMLSVLKLSSSGNFWRCFEEWHLSFAGEDSGRAKSSHIGQGRKSQV